jgi:E3 ubiquitin-protein ligase DOA10
MIDMDYLERNIKDSYNQKIVMIQPARVQGSTVMFFALLIFWSIAVAAWRLM